MERQVQIRSVSTPDAPAAIGPYSQAVQVHGVVFCSGQIGLDPATGKLVEGGVIEQATQALNNLGAVLRASGSAPHRVLKTTVFLKDMADFPAVNGIYASFFGEHKPARATVAAAGLPMNALFEIECTALADEPVEE